MEKRDARLLQSPPASQEGKWNVLELESQSYKKIHSKICEFIALTNHSTLSTREIQQRLQQCQKRYGKHFAIHLVASLQQSDVAEREAIVWLLTQLHDQETIPLLQQLAHHHQQPRAIRLSASLALAGLGQTPEMLTNKRPRLYAIS
ncbi:hypothetical protein [Dictyobacter arantiisoli]|uniref:HEAT repeat domain-containing protein n=1 Tax=Dictyobacter arantiisoli TaxID=2014874 RepID=A0A5A5T8W7_9CHLR|nr:hypothetical protein [Dictyobacter arantiisoli]GCF07930.1 hypothetical protein KDI_14940 [Dictyobacter arantiisoli]